MYFHFVKNKPSGQQLCLHVIEQSFKPGSLERFHSCSIKVDCCCWICCAAPREIVAVPRVTFWSLCDLFQPNQSSRPLYLYHSQQMFKFGCLKWDLYKRRGKESLLHLSVAIHCGCCCALHSCLSMLLFQQTQSLHLLPIDKREYFSVLDSRICLVEQDLWHLMPPMTPPWCAAIKGCVREDHISSYR